MIFDTQSASPGMPIDASASGPDSRGRIIDERAKHPISHCFHLWQVRNKSSVSFMGKRPIFGAMVVFRDTHDTGTSGK